jgi:hypothetical protein
MSIPEDEIDQEPEGDEEISDVSIDMSIEQIMQSKPDKGKKISEKDREKCLCSLIGIFGNAIVKLADDPTGPTILEYDYDHVKDDNGWHRITQEEKDRGYVQLSSVDIAGTSQPVGTGVRHHLKVDDAIMLYFPILISDKIPEDKKLEAIIEYDDLHGINHARWFRRLREAGVI